MSHLTELISLYYSFNALRSYLYNLDRPLDDAWYSSPQDLLLRAEENWKTRAPYVRHMKQVAGDMDILFGQIFRSYHELADYYAMYDNPQQMQFVQDFCKGDQMEEYVPTWQSAEQICANQHVNVTHSDGLDHCDVELENPCGICNPDLLGNGFVHENKA